MRLTRILALATVVLSPVYVMWGALPSGGRPRPLDWRAVRVATGAHLAMQYPTGWDATSHDGRDLVVASFPLSKSWLASERKSVPAGGVYIWAFSYGRLPHSLNSFPHRPPALELDRKTFGYYECGFNLAGYNLVFEDHGLKVQVMVALGRQADEHAALAVIDRLRVA